MLYETALRWIDDCEWIEEIEPGTLGDYYLEDTYRLKPGAPEDIKKRWDALCNDFRLHG